MTSSLRHFTYGVLLISTEKYRYRITPPSDSDQCTVAITSPNKKLKWSGSTSISSSIIIQILSGETIGYKWVSDVNQPLRPGRERIADPYIHLSICIGKMWLVLQKGEYSIEDSLIEELIQYEKRNSSIREKDEVIVGLKKTLTETQNELGVMRSSIEEARKDTKKALEEASVALAEVKKVREETQKSLAVRKSDIDLQVELTKLQKMQTDFRHMGYLNGSCLRVASTSAVSNGSYVNWNNNGTTPYNMHSSFFYTFTNSNQINFHQPGVYLISTHISSQNSGNGNYVSLYHNDNDISRCHSTNANGYYHAFQISNLVLISNPNEYMSVYYTANTNNYAAVQENQLSITCFSRRVWGEPTAALRVSSSAPCSNGGTINWNQIPLNTNQNLYTVSGTTITVNKSYWYLVTLQMTSYSSNNSCHAEIRVNGTVVCRTRSSNGSGYFNPLNFSDIILIPAGGRVTVRYTGNNPTYVSGNSQQLSLLALQEDEQAILSLASSTSTTNGNYVNWDTRHCVSDPWYQMSSEKRITFLRGGIYLVCSNIPIACTGNSGYFSIYINGGDVSRTRHSEASGYYQTVTICEVVQINTGQYLEMYYSGNHQSMEDVLGTKLAVVPLCGWI